MTQPAPDQTVQRQRALRLAVQHIAAPAQAQRRYAGLGWLRGTVTSYLELSADRELLARSFNDEQIALLQELRAQLARELDADPDFIDDKGAERREYIFTDALETEQWQALRLLARRCWTAIAGEESPFIAIQAR